MSKLILNLNLNEVNNVIKALGNLPYNQINELIAKIHMQATAQLEAKPEEKKDEAEK